MRALFSFPLLAYLLVAPAARADLNGSGELVNLNYYPHRDFFLFNPSVTDTITEQTKNSNGGGAALSAQTFQFGVVYGVRPGLRLGVSESILWDSVSDSGPATTGGENASTNAGFSNPTVTTSWRLVDDERLHLSGDLTASMTPSLGAKLAANSSLNTIGNDYDGASTLYVQTTWFWRYARSETALTARATHTMDGRTNGSAASNSYDTLPYWYYSLTLTDRLHLGDRWFIQGAVTYNYSRSAYLNYDDSSQSEQRAPNSMDPKLTMGWSPEPGYLFTLTATFHEATTITVSNATAQTGSRDSSALAELVFLHQL